MPVLERIQKNRNFIIFANQGFISLSNFIITIFLIRFLGISSFGEFSIYYIIFLLSNSSTASLIISPFLSNLPFEKNIFSFMGSVFIHQLFLSLLIALILFCTFIFLQTKIIFSNSEIFLSFLIWVIFGHFYQLFRRIIFAKFNILIAIFGDFVLFFLLIALILLFYNFQILSLINLIKIYAFCYIIGFAIFSYVLRYFNFSYNLIINDFKKNFISGRWLFLTSFFQWFSGNYWILISSATLGTAALGIFRACQTIINSSNVFFQAFENIFPIKTSEILKQSGVRSMVIFIQNFSFKGILFTSILILFLYFFSKPILILLFGNTFGEYNNYLLNYSFILPFIFLQFPISYILRSIRKTKPILISYIFSSLFTILLAEQITNNYKIYGLINGIIFAQLIIVTISLLGVLYYLKKQL